MVRAILFPLSLGYVTVAALSALIFSASLEATNETQKLAVAFFVACGFVAAFLGWAYFSGLRRGLTANPPNYRRAWRIAFAVVVSLWTLAFAGLLFARGNEILKKGTAESVAKYRQELEMAEADLKSKEAAGRDPDSARRRLKTAQEDLAFGESATRRIVIALGGAALFILASIFAWIDGFRRPRTLNAKLVG